ncbi:MAG: hypothetical protein CME65_13070 [Halobacteriovoraceae bacterium]|nr:hypothetical protein [Halobacteriovoraceae bacterium]|tara:strand:- start:6832 stop:7434 length:603 start_codon:yes stop_codon:yes gene_type:complete
MSYQLFESTLTRSNTKSLKRNQIIYHEGDKADGIYFVESGMVGLFHISENGKETFLRVFGPKSMFGHRSFLAKEKYHATTMALTATTIKHISSEQVEQAINQSPELLRSILEKVARDLGAAEIRMAGLQDKTTNQRIAESMLFLKYKYPTTVWTRKEIGEYSGSTHESVARFMSYCESEGIIKKHGRDFEILDEQKLLNN